jgi:TPR repeat protein
VLKTLGAIIVSIVLSFAQMASAGPLEDGAVAHKRGDYATALKLWRLMAEQGDARAQFSLGAMYQRGQGVTQDYKGFQVRSTILERCMTKDEASRRTTRKP